MCGKVATVLIDIIVYDGLDEMDALGPLEVLRSAGVAGANVTSRLVTLRPQTSVRGAFGLGFLPDGVYEPGRADVLLVPGGGWAARATEAGAWAEVQRGDWLPILADAADTVSIMAGVCTGTMLLAHAGVVGNRRAATHHAARDDLEATGATVIMDRVVDDGDLITCGGVTSGIDLALWLIEREFGRELAERLGGRMEYHRSRPVDHDARSHPEARTGRRTEPADFGSSARWFVPSGAPGGTGDEQHQDQTTSARHGRPGDLLSRASAVSRGMSRWSASAT